MLVKCDSVGEGGGPSNRCRYTQRSYRRNGWQFPCEVRHSLTTLGFCCATTMPTPGREVQAEWLGTSDAYRVSSKP